MSTQTKVTVMTKNPKTGRPSLFSRVAIQRRARPAGVLASLLRPAAVNMVKSQKLLPGFFAAGAYLTISIQHFLPNNVFALLRPVIMGLQTRGAREFPLDRSCHTAVNTQPCRFSLMPVLHMLVRTGLLAFCPVPFSPGHYRLCAA
jgi:hypothetical protein